MSSATTVYFFVGANQYKAITTLTTNSTIIRTARSLEMPQDSPYSSDNESSNSSVEDLLRDEPMYYVLGQFLMADNDKNIAMVLQDIAKELRLIREALTNKSSAQ